MAKMCPKCGNSWKKFHGPWTMERVMELFFGLESLLYKVFLTQFHKFHEFHHFFFGLAENFFGLEIPYIEESILRG